MGRLFFFKKFILLPNGHIDTHFWLIAKSFLNCDFKAIFCKAALELYVL